MTLSLKKLSGHSVDLGRVLVEGGVIGRGQVKGCKPGRGCDGSTGTVSLLYSPSAAQENKEGLEVGRTVAGADDAANVIVLPNAEKKHPLLYTLSLRGVLALAMYVVDSRVVNPCPLVFVECL